MAIIQEISRQMDEEDKKDVMSTMEERRGRREFFEGFFFENFWEENFLM